MAISRVDFAGIDPMATDAWAVLLNRLADSNRGADGLPFFPTIEAASEALSMIDRAVGVLKRSPRQ